ncbi:MAG TPA: acyl-CoA synthetase [Sideroxyarcus sp.]|nr:acyl-CoA synthetase [Sideroxyarcus sp.]
MQQQAPSKTGGPEWVAKPERSNTLAIRFIVWVALTLGRRVARLFLYPICLYFLWFAGDARAASRQYLRKVLGREPRMADGFRHIHTFASTILDRVFLLNRRFDKFDVQVHLDAAAQAMIASKRGCILLGAHLGSFEIMRAYAHEIDGPPASVVMYEENARKLNSVLKAINPDLAQQVIGLGKVDSMLKVEQALQRGEFIGILADRGLEHGGASVTLDFLGAPAKFPSGPLRMAYMLKSPVLLMVGVYRGGNRYELYVEELLDMSHAELPRNEAIRLAQQCYVARIEHYCRAAPYNWFNFYDFWK